MESDQPGFDDHRENINGLNGTDHTQRTEEDLETVGGHRHRKGCNDPGPREAGSSDRSLEYQGRLHRMLVWILQARRSWRQDCGLKSGAIFGVQFELEYPDGTVQRLTSSTPTRGDFGPFIPMLSALPHRFQPVTIPVVT